MGVERLVCGDSLFDQHHVSGWRSHIAGEAMYGIVAHCGATCGGTCLGWELRSHTDVGSTGKVLWVGRYSSNDGTDYNGSSVKNELACSSFIYTYAVTYDLTNAQSRAQYRTVVELA